MSNELIECYIFAVDYDNCSEEFWSGEGGKVWDVLEYTCETMDFKCIDNTNNENRKKDWILTDKFFGSCFKDAFEKCDGWSSPDYADSAPHPLVIIHTFKEPEEFYN